MSVGVLLVTHPGIATAMLGAARRVLRTVPVPVDLLEVPWDADLAEYAHRLKQAVRALDQGDGVLVLTDLYGATPANLARQLEPGRESLRVAGLNLPMLLRVLTYADGSLDELSALAYEGGRGGVIADG